MAGRPRERWSRRPRPSSSRARRATSSSRAGSTTEGLAYASRMGTAQRISYVPFESMDERMRAEMERCAREGTPRPESSAVRAHAPHAFWATIDAWMALFHGGICDHAIKELCRVYVSRTVKCEYCGNQRSTKAATTGGLLEQQYDALLNFEASDLYDDRQKAALAYTEAIVWRLDPDDDELWERLH